MPRVIDLGVEDDHVESIARVRPLRAVEELIWNSLDADANFVSVHFEENVLVLQRRVPSGRLPALNKLPQDPA